MRTLALITASALIGASLAALLIRRRVEVVERVVEKPVDFFQRERDYAASRKAVDPSFRSAEDIMNDYWAEEGVFAKWLFDMECEEDWKAAQAEQTLKEKRVARAS